MRAFLLLPCLNLLCLSVAFAQSTAQPARRVGFIIANGQYSKLPPVASAKAEALAMQAALRAASFEVFPPLFDARYSDLQKFAADLSTLVRPGDAVFVYFSGYAVLADESTNYLLPVDFDPRASGPFDERAYDLSNLASQLQRLNAGLKIIAVEGCRQVPVPGITAPGLAEPSLGTAETMFAMSAPPGQVVNSVSEGVSVFTASLAKRIDEPGANPARVAVSVKRDVSGASGLIPLIKDTIVANADFYFVPPKEEKPTIVIREVPAAPSGPPPYVPVPNSRDREEYVLITPGEFKMGCVPGDPLCDKDELPQHKVKITKPFWMGRNEVQAASYQRYLELGNKGAKMPPAPLWNGKWRNTSTPIVNLTVDEARSYCGWAGGQLPSEAQWEYAARTGKDEIYPLGEDSREKANFEGKKGNDTYDQEAAPVRKFDASPWNLFDMAGNVWEMVNDYYSTSHYASSPESDPMGPASGKETVKRGGSFNSDAKKHLRTSIRKPFAKFDNATGFRCVLEDNDATHKLLKLP